MPITDTSGNVVHGSGSFTFVASDSDLLYRALIKPIRDLDNGPGNLFVKRFLARPQEWYDDTASRIADLSLTDSPVTCREDLLKYLKDIVGLTSQLDDITSRLTTHDLRKLITIAVPLWKRKGTTDGLMTVCRLLTGRTPLYFDWFQFRNILGETEVGEDELGNDNWLIGGESTALDEFVSHIRMMDDGSLDEQLLLDLLSIFRPLSERLEIALLDHLDRFDDLTLNRWNLATGYSALGSLDTVNKEMVLAAGAGMVPVVPRFPPATSITNVKAQYKFKLVSAASQHRCHVSFTSAANQYHITISTTSMVLVRVTGGVATTLTTIPFIGAPIQVVPGAYYTLRVEAHAIGMGTRVRVYLDSSNFIDTTDTTGTATNGQGTVQLAALPATGEVRIDNYEQHAGVLRYATIRPGGITQTSNFIA